MDIDCDWCICGKKTTNGRLYCSEECKLSDFASDSSANSDYSQLSNHSPSFVPVFYNTSKKMNKNYVQLLKGNKIAAFGHNLNAGPHPSKGHQSTLNPSSPTYQKQTPLSARYNQANLMRSSGGLMGMNTNTTVVTTHVNTSGHIIQASTSAPKIAEVDPSMIPPTNLYYSRRYSLPAGHPYAGNGVNNILINVTMPDETRETEHDNDEEALTPPPPFGGIDTTTTTSHLIHGLHHHPRLESTTSTSSSSSSGSSEDDDQTLHSTQTISHNNSLDRLGEPSSLRVMPSSSFTKTLKPISEGMVSQSDTTNTTLQNSDVSTTSTTTTTNTSPSRENNYTLYKTSASTNLCALNQASGNVQKKHCPNSNVKMMSGGIKQAINYHPSLKSSSVESAASNTAITPIYF